MTASLHQRINTNTLHPVDFEVFSVKIAIKALVKMNEERLAMYLLFFLVPESHLEVTKKAIFAVGAGSIGHYSHCAWQTLGEGQFMPLAGSNAFIGEIGKLERVSEYKVEIICTNDQIKDAVAALKEAHPYETPSYHVIRLETI